MSQFAKSGRDVALQDRAFPTVSVVIPCRNETAYIKSCLLSVLRSDYPTELLDIIVVDGGSTDGTRDLLERMQGENLSFRVLDNPRQIVSTAMNIGILDSRAEIIVRMDAHCEYPSDYVRLCVFNLMSYGVDDVGGLWLTEPADSSAQALAVALAQTSPFGVGGAAYRLGSSEVREVDTVPFGTYWRQRLIDIGLYNEAFVRNQDIELNARLRAAGGHILLIPSIRCRYFAKPNIKELARQSYYNGFWVAYGLRFARASFSMRHVVPFVCLVTAVTLLASGWGVVLGGLILVYLLLTSWASIRQSDGHRESLGWLLIAFPVIHVSYALGTTGGLGALLFHPLMRQSGSRP